MLCEGACIITHSGTLITISNSLTIQGNGRVDLLLTKLNAKEFHISALAGHMHIYGGSVSSDSDMYTQNGDVVYQSTNSMRIMTSSNFTYPCLYAPYIKAGPMPTVAFSNCKVINRTGSVSKCPSYYDLCSLSDVACTGLPSITLKTLRGNIAANVIPNDGGFPEDMDDYIMHNGTGDLNFDKKSNISLAEFNSQFASTAQADSMINVKFGNYRCFSTAAASFIGATNPAYLSVRPWFISFFSANLLMGDVYIFTDGPIPGFCPFRTSLTFNDLGEYRNLILKSMTSPSGKFDISFVYNKQFPRITESNTNLSGFRGYSGPIQFYDIQASQDGEYYLAPKDLADAVTLELTVIVSLLLCLLIGVIFEYVLIIVLNAVIENFKNQKKHLQSYLKRGSEKRGAVKVGQIKLSNVDIAKAEVAKPGSCAIVKLLKSLPSQYMLLDMLVREIKNHIQKSSLEFFKLIFVEVEEKYIDDTFKPIPFAEIKEQYEKLCFLRQSPEDDLKSEANLQFLARKGFIFESCKDATTQVLRKVKWKERNPDNNAVEITSDISSFEQFFHIRIETTEFDEDTIDLEEFIRKYKTWCSEVKLPPIVVTRTMLFDIFGVVSDRKEVSFLKKNMESQEKKKVFYNVNLERAKFEIRKLQANPSDPIAKRRPPKIKGEIKRLDYLPFLLDFVSVWAHVVCISFLVGVPIVLPLYVEAEYTKYTNSDYDYGLNYQDIIVCPWQIFRKTYSLSPTTWACCIISLIYWIFATIDLLTFYIYTPLTYTGFNESKKTQKKMPGCVIIVQKLSWCYILLILMIISMYIALVLVWALLGAILNPNAYLAYAAGAGTLITFVTSKYSEFMKIYNMGVKGLHDKLMEKFKSYSIGIMRKVLISLNLDKSEIGKTLNQAAESGDIVGTFKSRAAAIVANTPLGKQLSSYGLDINQAMALAQGDINAIAELAAKQGIPKQIVTLVVSLAKKDKEKVIETIQELAVEAHIPKVIIRLGMAMLHIDNEKSVSTLISIVTSEWVNFIESQMPEASRSPAFSLIKEVLPQIIMSVKDLCQEEETTFIAAIEKINKYVITAMKQMVEVDMSKDPQVKLKYFTEAGLPKFAIPEFVLQALELHKMYASEGGQLSLPKIQKCLFIILDSFCSIDKRIISFIFMIINEGLDENASKGDAQGLFKSREEQYDLIKFIEEKLGLPSPILQVIWKIRKSDYTQNDKMVDQLTEILRKLGPGIKRAYVAFAFDLLPLMNITMGKKLIRTECIKFGVRKSYSKFISLIGTVGKSPQEIIEALDGPIVTSIAEKIRMPIGLLKGMMLFISGDFSSPLVMSFIEDLCTRANIKKRYATIIVSLLTIFTSDDCHTLLPALQALGVKNHYWILIGKKMLHPMNVPDRFFAKDNISLDEPAIKFRHAINMKDSSMWERWVNDIKDIMEKAHDKVVEAEGGLNSAKNFNETVKEEEKRVETSAKEADNLVTRVKRFLSIEEYDINQDIIKDLLIDCPMFAGKMAELSKLIDPITKLCQIKDITKLSDVTLTERAIKFMSNELQYDTKIIQAIFDMIHMRSQKSFIEGVTTLMSSILPASELTPFVAYSRFAFEKQSALENVERILCNLGEKFKIPVGLLIKIIAPFLKSSKSIQIEDVYCLLNQFGMNIESRDSFSLKFGDKTMSAEDIRYFMSGIIVHDPNAFLQISLALGAPPQLINFFKAFLDPNPYNKIKLVIEFFRDISVKFGVSLDLYYSVVGIVIFSLILLALVFLWIWRQHC